MSNTSGGKRGQGKLGCLVLSVVGLLVLVLLILPAIPDAAGSARMTNLKNKARAIWTAIMTVNMEREEQGLPPVWPDDVRYGDPPQPVQWPSAAQYFRYLMSSINYTGDPRLAVPSANPEERIVPDLEPELLAGLGVPVAPSVAEFSDRYCAWHVARVGQDTPGGAPFLIGRNVHLDGDSLELHGDGRTLLTLDRTPPLGRKSGVWITRGGGCIAARRKYLSEAIFFDSNVWDFSYSPSMNRAIPIATNRIDVIACRWRLR